MYSAEYTEYTDFHRIHRLSQTPFIQCLLNYIFFNFWNSLFCYSQIPLGHKIILNAKLRLILLATSHGLEGSILNGLKCSSNYAEWVLCSWPQTLLVSWWVDTQFCLMGQWKSYYQKQNVEKRNKRK